VARSIRGRFDGRPQQCTVTRDGGAVTLSFRLDSIEDGTRTLTVTLPSLRAEDFDDGFAVHSSDSSDGLDAGYHGYVRVTPEDRWAQLRIDNHVRPAFWLTANLSGVFFA
jgi:hypothetical protein